MSNYPPGVTGNEPHLTGDYPCAACGGVGGDFDEDGGHACWMCAGSGHHPEDCPACPECGDAGTDWFGDLTPEDRDIWQDATEFVPNYDEYNVVVCHACGKVSR